MAVVFVSIGSNVDRNIYVANAIDALHKYFGKVVLSHVALHCLPHTRQIARDGRESFSSALSKSIGCLPKCVRVKVAI